ncbi:MAG: phosphoribosyl-ATP diphosphatase [Treponema sp.]|jgi:phosphoribosyl-ATP pyrophosphohydrolase/phosphoribosyl-AMP cyclohydrolase|nr:phosphoribosyl-ATP diphosphatase [Treponema sp.]
MVIASIDVQGGKVVQLRQGAEKALERSDAGALAEDFNRYGEVAAIDLDAAMGRGENRDLIRGLLRKAECRVGGGIRSAAQAREWVRAGACKVITGSAALRSGAGFGVNVPFLEGLARAVGRERVVAAVDARKGGAGYEITVDGWKTPTGLPLVETARAIEPFAGEVLFTCVDREGLMGGIDTEPVRALREALECRLTVAGGVHTLDEIETLAGLGCDVQLGMALYTGAIDLSEAFIRSLNWQKGATMAHGGDFPAPLLPIIAQASDGQVLMTGYTDAEALSESFRTGNLCFHSRTRNELWMKGRHSGKVLRLQKLRADCDRDALLATVDPVAEVCHTGAWSCFETGRAFTLERMQSLIAEGLAQAEHGGETQARERLLEAAQGLGAAGGRREQVTNAARLFFSALGVLAEGGIPLKEVLREMEERYAP